MTMIRNTLLLALAAASVEAVVPSNRGVAKPSFTMTSLKSFDIIAAFYDTQPYAAAFMICSFKASAADLVVQSQDEEQKQKDKEPALDFDLQRNLGFLLYGGIYQGCVQEYLYNTVFPSVFGDSHSWLSVFEQVALDMTVLTPFVCLPISYMMRAAVADESLLDGLRKYASHVQYEGLLQRYWSIWAPVQVLTFGFLPHHLRIPFVAFVSFFWLMILSSLSKKETLTTDE